MTGPFTRAFPPPINWQDFERLSYDLYRRLWKTNDAELHGRLGQPQSGVDVYGTDRVENRFTGVQCKGKDKAFGRPATIKELRSEVEKAKTFRPKLDVFILVTTTPNDIALQQEAREISQAHKASGLFEVRVTGWTTLAQRITDHPDLVQKYYPDLAPVVGARIEDAIGALRGDGAETRALMESGHAAILAALDRKPDAGDPLQSRISEYANLIEEGKPATGLMLLEKLWANENKNASPRSRYRMRANIGVARLLMGEVDKAIADMRAAYAEDPAWVGARAILAMAELQSGNRDRAFELVCAVLEEDSTIVQAATVVADAAPDTMPLAEVEALIPPALRERLDVLLTLAHRARSRGDIAAQEAYVIRAAGAEPDDWRVLAAQGELLLAPIFDIPGLALTHAIPAPLAQNVDAAIALLQRAWAALRNRDNARMGAYVGANLLSILEVAGRDAELDRTLDEALKIAPDFEPFLRKYAQRMMEADDWQAARKALGSIPAGKLQVQDRLALVKIDMHTGHAVRAIEAANKLETELGQEKLAEVAAALQVEASFTAGCDVRLIPEVLGRWPNSVLVRSIAHNLMPDDDERRAALLQEIRGLAAKITDPGDRVHAADALFVAKQFSAAADMYAGLYAVDKDSLPLNRALRSLLMADRRKEARELFEHLTPEVRELPSYADIGVAIYEHCGLLDEARVLIEETLTRKDSLRRRLHWIGICERLNQLDEVRAWLSRIHEDIDGPPDERMQLALAVDRHLQSPKGFAIGYRALRDGYNDPQVHLGYMLGLVFTGLATRRAFRGFESIAADSAATLLEKGGSRKLVRIIETLPDTRAERDEIGPRDPLARQLIGKKVGDEVEVPSLGAEPTIYVVTEIRDKFLQAHFRSLEQFESMFPGHPGFGSFQIDESKGDEKFKPLFDSAKKRGEHTLQLIDLYRRGQLPLMLLARFSGHSPSDVWEWVVGKPNLPLRSCSGSQELASALEVLAATDKAVIDPITLYSLVRLGIFDQVKRSFTDLAVVQTTLDLFRRLVHERRESGDKQHGSFGWDGERYFMVEADQESANRRIAVAEEALAFAESLTLVPSEPDKGVRDEALTLFEDCDPAFMDTIYAAQGNKRVLLTDDMLFRQVAWEASGVRGVWSQSALMSGGRAGRVTFADYQEVTRVLAAADYRFTTIDHQIVHAQLSKDDWRISPSLRNIADQIADPTNEVGSVTRMLADLMKTCRNAAPNNASLVGLWTAVFEAFARAQPDRDLAALANEVMGVLASQFHHNANATIYRRRLMASTVHTPVSQIRQDVDDAVGRVLESVARVFEAALAKVARS